MWETWVRYQSWKDPQEEGMETQSGILAWRIKMATGAFQAIVHGVAKCWTQLSNSANTQQSLCWFFNDLWAILLHPTQTLVPHGPGMGLWDAASDTLSEAVEIHGPRAYLKNQGLNFQASSSLSCCLLPLEAAHLCQPQSTPQPGHSYGLVQWRPIVHQGLCNFVFLLLLIVFFIPCVSFPCFFFYFFLDPGNSSPWLIGVLAALHVVLNL